MRAPAFVLFWLAALPALAQPPSPAPGTFAPELAAPDPRDVLGVPRGRGASGAELEAETEQTAALLRCPVCQGLSIADSPSPMALNMKRQVRDLLARGYDREQVMVYFERSYGEFVRLQPPLRGINWLLWTAPAIALLAGGLVVARMLRGRAAVPAAPVAPAEAVDPALERYVEAARALAQGSPAAPPPRPAPPAPESGGGR